MQLQQMKGALHYLYTIKLHVPNFDCGYDCGSDGPTATNQDIPMELKSTPPNEQKSIDYQMLPLISKRLTPVSYHISPIPFWHTATRLQTMDKFQTSRGVQHITCSVRLDSQIERTWEVTVIYPLNICTINSRASII